MYRDGPRAPQPFAGAGPSAVRGVEMAERKPLVAGNWKMNGLRADGVALARGVAERARQPHRCELLVCPPATLLIAVGEALAGSGVGLGGQDCHPEPKGAFTGDISAEMLKDAGCSHAIVGHSERRHACGETDADVRAKTLAAWRAGLVAIVCVGETRLEREAGGALAVVAAQLAGSLADIAEMHAAIRARIPAGTRILYGGSVNPKNAAEIVALGDVDGALVGGASLKAEDFWAIAQACG